MPLGDPPCEQERQVSPAQSAPSSTDSHDAAPSLGAVDSIESKLRRVADDWKARRAVRETRRALLDLLLELEDM